MTEGQWGFASLEVEILDFHIRKSLKYEEILGVLSLSKPSISWWCINSSNWWGSQTPWADSQIPHIWKATTFANETTCILNLEVSLSSHSNWGWKVRCFRLLIEFGNVSKFEYDKSSILMHLNFDMQVLRNGSPRDVSHTKQYSSTALSFRFMFISWRKDDKLWLCHLIHKFIPSWMTWSGH